MELEEYFEHPSVSQSKLKSLLIHPKLFNSSKEPDLYFEEKEHFTIGSGVDCQLTQSKEEWDRRYHTSELKNKPNDTVKSIIKQSLDKIKELGPDPIGSITEYPEIIFECCQNHDYCTSFNKQTRINRICESWEYWEDMKLSEGKIVLSKEEKTLIDAITMSIRTNPATAKYFDTTEWEIQYQVFIEFEYEGVPCKALLDMVCINREKKIILPIDIKTLSDYTINFPKSLRRRRYDIQAAFYTKALESIYPSTDFTILPFKFIVESTTEPSSPLVFTCSQELLHIGEYGRHPLFLTGYLNGNLGDLSMTYGRTEEILGFRDLISLYKYYIEHGFETPKKIREAESEFVIDWSGIIEY